MATRATATAGASAEAKITAGEFNAALETIPYSPAQSDARGLLAPLMRASGHILYLIGATAEEKHVVMPEEEKNELTAAAAHLADTSLLTLPVISDEANRHIKTFVTAVGIARDNFEGWSPEDRTTALRNLANRAAGLGAFLDRELTGINPAQSDPGSAL